MLGPTAAAASAGKKQFRVSDPGWPPMPGKYNYDFTAELVPKLFKNIPN